MFDMIKKTEIRGEIDLGRRFAQDFKSRLMDKEFDDLKSEIVISSWGGSGRARPSAFTEQGVAMLSSLYP
jgi:hypothetical protein